MLFVIRVNEVLNLSHGEFSNSEQTLLGMDFISVTKSNLGCSERHSAIVELQKSSEIDEDTLSSFWPEETSLSTSRSNLSFKHKIERNGIREFIVCFRCFDIEFLNS